MTSTARLVAGIFELKCAVQQYAWGKKGSESVVARLKAAADPDFVIDEQTPYAELWMGTHPNGPSIVSIPGYPSVPLSQWIKEHPEQLGTEMNSYFKGNLPFLFKVLSVKTALSIQAHPNKVLAEILHATLPDLYKDDNHKPEMAIALTKFTALCGFRPIKEVAHFLQSVDEFREAVGEKSVKLITASHSMDMPLHREAMKHAFKSLMERSTEVITRTLNLLVTRVKKLKDEGADISHYAGDILLKLNSEFPGDRGCFAIYFLNIVELEPGEAMFLEDNLPHAYLSGDCMECMACSDNVVRAGLTVKYIDVHTLCEMLDYTGRPVSRTKFCGIESLSSNTHVTIFNPPVPEFGVTKFEIPKGTKDYRFQSYEGASICIIISGEGQAASEALSTPMKLKTGTVFFVAADVNLHISVTGGENLILFRAYPGTF
ncbi:unnamed protein product [Candidula unifasciata]|uniref:mannose-6-phosphate isomerase n=1 Tax=Candidula unifasciata TaxID=100452 RepID=A0A8S3YQV6_9EUPU|nr:unnamed protein product [Candidula unifasciata]